MKLSKTLLATSALTVAAAGAYAAGHGMADSMTLVSWGGAYQASQQNAYVAPYIENSPRRFCVLGREFGGSCGETSRNERSGQHHMGSG